MREALKSSRGARLESVVVDGDVPSSLLSIADRAYSDCIAVGSGRHPLDDHCGPGRTATTLVKCGKRPLLVVPPPRAAVGDLPRVREALAHA
jgi:nucleotide-binding universal stress UspA family protein